MKDWITALISSLIAILIPIIGWIFKIIIKKIELKAKKEENKIEWEEFKNWEREKIKLNHINAKELMELEFYIKSSLYDEQKINIKYNFNKDIIKEFENIKSNFSYEETKNDK
ncbi:MULTISPECIES: hypothetical protein [unclassified Spiroplasma]|uniref:hypothetical protein n=1 Tax=unclassified Spiroplasma TaxID=2637901 RepID=UPI00313C8B0E